MPRNRRRDSVDTKDRNLYPLLRVLKAEVGIDWGVYQEFLDGVKAAIANGESYSAWTTQIELLIQSPAARMAHEGVLLLLREPDVKVHSHTKTTPDTDTDINTENMNTPPPTPVATPTRSTLPAVPRNRTNNRVAMPAPGVKPPVQPMRAAPTYRKIEPLSKNDPVLFSDPIYKLDVQNFFGSKSSSSSNNNTGAHIRRTPSLKRPLAEPRSAPMYNAADDDLAVWRKRLGVEQGVQNSATQDDTNSPKATENFQQDRHSGSPAQKK